MFLTPIQLNQCQAEGLKGIVGHCGAWFEQGAKWEWIFIFLLLLKFFSKLKFHWNYILFDHPTIRNSASPYWIMEKYSKRRNRCKALTCLAYNLQNFSNFMPILGFSRKNIMRNRAKSKKSQERRNFSSRNCRLCRISRKSPTCWKHF